jgi:NADP-dependent 3-hydroxy acid dehydrogenase YdfG
MLQSSTNHRRDQFRELRAAITGGTSGLGLALVRELLDRGARVAFVARGRDGVERVEHRYPESWEMFQKSLTFIQSLYKSWGCLAGLMF